MDIHVPKLEHALFDIQCREGRVVVVTADEEVLDVLDDALAAAEIAGLSFRFDVPRGSDRTCHEIVFPEGLDEAQVRTLLSTLPGVPVGGAV